MPVKPVFDLRAILPVAVMFVVTAVETVGDISGVTEGGMGREATDKELSGGIICDGLGSTFAAFFGVLPNTSFSQNVGLVTMTKIVNRTALAFGAVFLVLCGLLPKLAALVSIMPQSVLGGAAVIMFSSIVMSGIQLITSEKLTPRNMTIVSVALGLGYGMGSNTAVLAGLPQLVQLIFGGSGNVAADTLLIDFVRAHGCKSVKRGCETSNCGLCTVFLDEKPVLSCSVLAARASGHSITTLEGLPRTRGLQAKPPSSALHSRIRVRAVRLLQSRALS